MEDGDFEKLYKTDRRIDDDVIRKVVDRMGPTADLNARHTQADT